jgi:hypothetical protein
LNHPPVCKAGAEGEGEMKPTSGALIYTILVDGKPVVALEARGREAAELCREEWFRSDLCALSSNGEPLCGIGSKLQARPALKTRGPNSVKGQRKLKLLTTFCSYIWLIWTVYNDRQQAFGMNVHI